MAISVVNGQRAIAVVDHVSDALALWPLRTSFDDLNDLCLLLGNNDRAVFGNNNLIRHRVTSRSNVTAPAKIAVTVPSEASSSKS